MPRPIPLVEPVTTDTRPSKGRAVCSSRSETSMLVWIFMSLILSVGVWPRANSTVVTANCTLGYTDDRRLRMPAG